MTVVLAWQCGWDVGWGILQGEGGLRGGESTTMGDRRGGDKNN
jgi:hypothetical protein